jgi:hypothetical protein
LSITSSKQPSNIDEYLDLSELKQAALDSSRARYLTHRLYRYPASMSPMIARSLINKFSKRGDLLLDPFCGGGTTAVEGLALGRNVVCADISPLACFVTKAKATMISVGSLEKFSLWHQKEMAIIENYHPKNRKPLKLSGRIYSPITYSNILKLMKDAESITDPSARRLAQLAVLNVAKRSFDGRSKSSPRYLVKKTFQRLGNETIECMREYLDSINENGVKDIGKKPLRVIQCDAKKIAKRLSAYKNKFSLVVTSPPYPGVHVLYNRWQLHGRKETDLPFRLLCFSNTFPASFYTMGARNSRSIKESYTRNMESILTSIHELLVPGGIIAQVIAFPKNNGRFQDYEGLMKKVGFEPIEPRVPTVKRHVPNRKWYTHVVNGYRQPLEHIFIHQKLER